MTDTKETELLPCPLCHGDASKKDEPQPPYGDYSYEVYGCHMCDLWCDELTIWNTRAPLPNEAELVEIVKKAMLDVGVPMGITRSYKKWASAIITALRPYLSGIEQTKESE